MRTGSLARTGGGEEGDRKMGKGDEGEGTRGRPPHDQLRLINGVRGGGR